MLGRKEKLFLCYIAAAYVRLWLLNSDYQEVIANHIEVSTPVNSWKRGKLNIYIYFNHHLQYRILYENKVFNLCSYHQRKTSKNTCVFQIGHIVLLNSLYSF